MANFQERQLRQLVFLSSEKRSSFPFREDTFFKKGLDVQDSKWEVTTKVVSRLENDRQPTCTGAKCYIFSNF